MSEKHPNVNITSYTYIAILTKAITKHVSTYVYFAEYYSYSLHTVLPNSNLSLTCE